jgi:murein DD-endopeptidase MepM/ murein hydrolase activator NlpD
MIRRAALVVALGTVAACSQRSPWTVVPAPVGSPSAAPAPTQVSATASDPVVVPAAAPADATAVAHLRDLHFPVAGLDSTRLDDSFEEPRDGGARKHNAIDIMAPRGSPVLSVQDGRVLRLSRSVKGGINLYATDLESRYVYYYAHLDRYHDAIYVGKPLLRGDTLGYVGTTGNAPDNLPHLHFQVMRMPGDGRYWNGEPINPYPLLKATASIPSAR